MLPKFIYHYLPDVELRGRTVCDPQHTARTDSGLPRRAIRAGPGDAQQHVATALRTEFTPFQTQLRLALGRQGQMGSLQLLRATFTSLLSQFSRLREVHLGWHEHLCANDLHVHVLALQSPQLEKLYCSLCDI